MAEQNKEKASVSMEAQLEKISATIESLSKEVVCDSVVLVCHILPENNSVVLVCHIWLGSESVVLVFHIWPEKR